MAYITPTYCTCTVKGYPVQELEVPGTGFLTCFGHIRLSHVLWHFLNCFYALPGWAPLNVTIDAPAAPLYCSSRSNHQSVASQAVPLPQAFCILLVTVPFFLQCYLIPSELYNTGNGAAMSIITLTVQQGTKTYRKIKSRSTARFFLLLLLSSSHFAIPKEDESV